MGSIFDKQSKRSKEVLMEADRLRSFPCHNCQTQLFVSGINVRIENGRGIVDFLYNKIPWRYSLIFTVDDPQYSLVIVTFVKTKDHNVAPNLCNSPKLVINIIFRIEVKDAPKVKLIHHFWVCSLALDQPHCPILQQINQSSLSPLHINAVM